MSAENKAVEQGTAVEAKKKYKVIAGTFRELGKANARLEVMKKAKIEGFEKVTLKAKCGTYIMLVKSDIETKEAAGKVQEELSKVNIISSVE